MARVELDPSRERAGGAAVTEELALDQFGQNEPAPRMLQESDTARASVDLRPDPHRRPRGRQKVLAGVLARRRVPDAAGERVHFGSGPCARERRRELRQIAEQSFDRRACVASELLLEPGTLEFEGEPRRAAIGRARSLVECLHDQGERRSHVVLRLRRASLADRTQRARLRPCVGGARTRSIEPVECVLQRLHLGVDLTGAACGVGKTDLREAPAQNDLEIVRVRSFEVRRRANPLVHAVEPAQVDLDLHG
ncbi:MAG: hypothetical protein AAFP86_02630 [Planctomycetota bacterium]